MASPQSQTRPYPVPSQAAPTPNSLRRVAVDDHTIKEFRTKYGRPGVSDQASLDLHVFEWDEQINDGFGEHHQYQSIDNVPTSAERQVRVIFAPKHITPHPENIDGLEHLFRNLSIPRAFVAESLLDISQSFATQGSPNETSTWFHLLAKDVEISKHGRRQIVQSRRAPSTAQYAPGSERIREYSKGESQANFNWVKPGFVLKLEEEKKNATSNTSTPNSSSGSVATLTNKKPRITLTCFGAPRPFLERFLILAKASTGDELQEDPYYLLEVALGEMWHLMDRAAWRVSEVFGEIEKRTLAVADTPAKANKEVDFPGLHNLAKHAIYMRENNDSAMQTLECLYARHKSVYGEKPEPAQLFTRQALEYRKTMFYSTQRRLSSLEKRMDNILQLSFHWVTQNDSLIMMSESLCMKAIAVATLTFMPLGTVAAIFGTQLIRLDDDPPHHARVSQDFWLLWIISVPLTMFVLVFWRVWYQDKRAQLKGKAPIRGYDDRGYMGWKRVGQQGLVRLEDLKKRLKVSPGKLERDEHELTQV